MRSRTASVYAAASQPCRSGPYNPCLVPERQRVADSSAPQARCAADPRRLGPPRGPDRQRDRPGAHCRTGTRLLARLPAHADRTPQGRHVGLPDGQMGNSEVGHMNLGAGRDRVPGPHADRRGDRRRQLLRATPSCSRACDAAQRARRHAARDGPAVARRRAQPRGRTSSRCSSWPAQRGVPTRRRARLPRRPRHAAAVSAEPASRALAARLRRSSATRRIATVSGRYFAMDRDQRWERVEPRLRRDRRGAAPSTARPMRWPRSPPRTRAARTTSSCSRPCIAGDAPMRDGDAVVFMNFRADRARQLTARVRARRLRRLRARRARRAVALRLPDRVRRDAAGAGRVRAGRACATRCGEVPRRATA